MMIMWHSCVLALLLATVPSPSIAAEVEIKPDGAAFSSGIEDDIADSYGPGARRAALSKLRVKQLRTMLYKRGPSAACKGCAEKRDFVERVIETDYMDPLGEHDPLPSEIDIQRMRQELKDSMQFKPSDKNANLTPGDPRFDPLFKYGRPSDGDTGSAGKERARDGSHRVSMDDHEDDQKFEGLRDGDLRLMDIKAAKDYRRALKAELGRLQDHIDSIKAKKKKMGKKKTTKGEKRKKEEEEEWGNTKKKNNKKEKNEEKGGLGADSDGRSTSPGMRNFDQLRRQKRKRSVGKKGTRRMSEAQQAARKDIERMMMEDAEEKERGTSIKSVSDSQLIKLLQRDEIKNFRVRQLRRILGERGESCDNCLEKKEFVNAVTALARQLENDNVGTTSEHDNDTYSGHDDDVDEEGGEMGETDAERERREKAERKAKERPDDVVGKDGETRAERKARWARESKAKKEKREMERVRAELERQKKEHDDEINLDDVEDEEYDD